MLLGSEVSNNDNFSFVFYVLLHISLQAHIIFISQNNEVIVTLFENRYIYFPRQAILIVYNSCVSFAMCFLKLEMHSGICQDKGEVKR